MDAPLRLKVADAEDLAVAASCLQDALIMLRDIAYLPEERRFVLVANRFRWERQPAAPERFERVTCGVSAERVTAVRRRNLEQGDGDRILSLLTIRPVTGGLEWLFSGDAAIRLEADRIDLLIRDLGEPWPTPWRPEHATAGG
jgi:hypothetical protein